MKRRTFLLGSMAGAAGLAGCYALNQQIDSDGGLVGNGNGGIAGDETSGSGDEDGSESLDESTDESGDGSDAEEEDGSTEDEDDENPEDQLTPDEDESDIDRDDYEQHEEREHEERDEADVETTADAREDEAMVIVEGTVENVSDVPIDTVDLDISFYGSGEGVDEDGYLGATFVSVEDLEPGESEAFESATEADELAGEVEEIDVGVTVYEFNES